MSKKTPSVPKWCEVIANSLATRCTTYESCVEAIMFDVDQFGEEDARARWEKILKERA